MKVKVEQKDLLMIGFNILVTLSLILVFQLRTVEGPAGSDGLPGSNGSNGLPGEDGTNGVDGVDGEDGLTPFIGENGNWWIGDTDTGVLAEAQDTTLDQTDFADLFSNFRLEQEREAYALLTTPDLSTALLKQNYVTSRVNEGYTLITTPLQFFDAINENPEGNFVLGNNIDFTGFSWESINVFEGILDGAGYELIGLSAENYNDIDPDFHSLFDQVFEAEVSNLTLRSFDFALGYSDNRANLFADFSFQSTYHNINVVNNQVLASIDSSVFIRESVRNTYYDINLVDNEVAANRLTGLLTTYSNSDTFINLNFLGNAMTTVYGFGGFLAADMWQSLASEIDIFSSSITIIEPLEIDPFTNEVRNLGFASGFVFHSIFDQIFVMDSQFILEADGSLGITTDGNTFFNWYNFGGVIGYGQNIILHQAIYDNEVLNMFNTGSFSDDYFNAENEAEYMGGIAGFLNDYVLIDVHNYTSISLHKTWAEFANVYDVAGILGYSAGLGTFQRVSNHGDIFNFTNTAGIVGSVGFAFSTGSITMRDVVNYGQIFGYEYVGGLVGSLDGYTSLDLQTSVQHSLVLGFRNVGGLVGFVSTQAGIEVNVERTLVDGQVFGAFNVGGVFGMTLFDPNSGLVGQVNLHRVVVLNDVQNVQFGTYFEGPFPFIIDTLFTMANGFFETDRAGRIVGGLYAHVSLSQVMVLERVVDTAVKRYDELTGDFLYLEDRVTGQYDAFGYGQGIVGFHWMDTLDESFIEDTLAMDRLIQEEGVWGLMTIDLSAPNLLDEFGQRVFLAPFAIEVYLNFFLI